MYHYIIEQLQYAENAMYSTQDDEYVSGHVSSGAAKALLAKVYVTIGSASMPTGNNITVKGGPAYRLDDNGGKVRIAYPKNLTLEKEQVKGYESFDSQEYYKLGMDKARELIELGDFLLKESSSELWDPSNKNGPEFIFTLQTMVGDDDFSNYVGTDYSGYFKENGEMSDGYWVQRDHWYQMFEEGDHRIKWGVIHCVPYTYSENLDRLIYSYYPAKDSVKVRLGLDGYEPTDELLYSPHLYGSKLMKFRQVTAPLDGNRTDFNWPYLRYAEVYLLYAEADNEVNNGPSSYAISLIDQLNNRNNSPKVSEIGSTTPWTKESFRSYILEERARELAAEGKRKFDLLRWGIYLQTMNAIGVDENDVIKRRDMKHLLLPLPANEVNTNEFIETNNPGW